MCLRIDGLPNRLFKWNGSSWQEINKSSTDSYAYNQTYIEYLVHQLENRTIELEDLSQVESEQVAKYIEQHR